MHITEWNSHFQWVTYYIISNIWPSRKGKSLKTVKMISGYLGLGEGINRAQRIFRAPKLLYDTWMMNSCHYTRVQDYVMSNTKNDVEWRSLPYTKVNYGLWVIMVCQCRFINGNKCTPLVRSVDNVGVYVCVGCGSAQETSIFLSIFLWTWNCSK